jgi:DNA polymerase III subunit alpha
VNIDKYHRRYFDEKELCDILYQNTEVDLTQYNLINNEKYNAAIKKNYSDLNLLNSLPNIDMLPEEWHYTNQQNWHMPEYYQNLDIAQWVLNQCTGDAEIQRAGVELLEYAEKNLLTMLCYLKYLVDTMDENSIVWGVGRGSSVASFVLYKIGIHRINSLYYDLDFHEFLR